MNCFVRALSRKACRLGRDGRCARSRAPSSRAFDSAAREAVRLRHDAFGLATPAGGVLGGRRRWPAHIVRCAMLGRRLARVAGSIGTRAIRRSTVRRSGRRARGEPPAWRALSVRVDRTDSAVAYERCRRGPGLSMLRGRSGPSNRSRARSPARQAGWHASEQLTGPGSPSSAPAGGGGGSCCVRPGLNFLRARARGWAVAADGGRTCAATPVRGCRRRGCVIPRPSTRMGGRSAKVAAFPGAGLRNARRR